MSIVTSYNNLGGKGDRRQLINISTFGTHTGTLNALINGSIDNSFYFSGSTPNSNRFIQFEFPFNAVINEITWRQNNTATHGTWKFQGSVNGIDWVDLGTSFILGGATTQIINTMSNNTTSFKFYRTKGVEGIASSSPYIQEIEFKIVEYNIVIKHLIKSSNKIHTLLDNTLTYPNLLTPTQEKFEQFGMDTLEGYENQVNKVAIEMDEDGVLEDGRVVRKIVNKNKFKINSLNLR